MAKLANAKGEMVYFNLVQKNGKLQWVIKGIGDTVVLGRDRQKKKSRTFTQEAQADAYLKRNGFTISLYEGAEQVSGYGSTRGRWPLLLFALAHGLPPSLPSGFFPLEKRRP